MRSCIARAKKIAFLFAVSFRTNFKAAREYRINFLLQVFGMVLNNAAFAVFWKLLLARTGTLAGYGFEDVMHLWALSSTSYGLAHVFFGNTRELARLIKEGDLDVYLLQPQDVLFNVSISRMQVSGWGDILYGLIVMVLLKTSALGWLQFAFFATCGAFVLTALIVLSETLSFWLQGTEGLGGIIVELVLSFSLYPETVFPDKMRWIFYSIIPTAFMVFIPLELFKTWSWSLAGLCLASALLYPVLSWLVFRKGLRHYASGNRVASRL